MIDVKLIRMMTGEEVITELLEESEDKITIKNALVVLPTQQGGVGFAQWASVIDMEKPELEISKKFVIYIAPVNDQVTKKYNEIFGSKLAIPEEKKLIL